MCGIWGRVSNAGHLDRFALFETQIDCMQHRGPDDSGFWLSPDRRVALGHRRLSIIDLSPAGHQPMLDESHGLAIVFNGEIYNFQDLRLRLEELGHVFRSNSDTEVLLAAYRQWGRDCVEHLHGMFSFCIHDQEQERLFLARDRAGEKPLYYAKNADGLTFASELKALLMDPDVPRNLDMQSFEYFLTYGHVPAERCILEGVHRLSQGHAMSYCLKSRSLDVWQYWRLPEPPTESAGTPEEFVAEYEALLEESVERQLVADVPVGVLLSGGLDSSLVTAMAVRNSSRRIRTYTICFPGHGVFDEGPYAKLVAEHFGTEHTELEMEPTSLDLLPELARQFDEPTADHAIVPTYLLSKAIRQEVTVALGGDGGDELFGGYAHYNLIPAQDRVRGLVPGPLRNLVSRTAGSFMPVGFTGRNHLIGLAGDTGNSVAHINLLQDVYSRKRLLQPDLWELARRSPTPESRRAGLCNPAHGPVRQAMEADFRSTMVDGYLVKVDRASMLASLEVRAPFLSRELIEFAYGRVPDRLKARGQEKKILSKLLAKKVLPRDLDIERKRGFTMPVHRWFEGEWGAFFREVLLGSNQDLFRRNTIEGLLEGQAKGRNNTVRLFGLAMFSLWRKEYGVGLPTGMG
jgi:asparagine synthase (glutamine-hydrolysing)